MVGINKLVVNERQMRQMVQGWVEKNLPGQEVLEVTHASGEFILKVKDRQVRILPDPEF